MTEEIYKTCLNEYEISNFGNCRRLLKNGEYKKVTGSILNRGYRYFQTKKKGNRINYLFHHLVAEQFIGVRPIGLEIDHIDRNKLNNNVSNLRYVTHLENSRNHYRIIEGIPFDENRQSQVCKKYRNEHIDELKIKKKEYYETNKELLLQKQKEKGNIPIECSLCKNIRNVSYGQSTLIKRSPNSVEGNICRKCSSMINLQKIRSNLPRL